ncbi:MAG: serine protease [Chloroflexi bacterium]|nr:serine protease [Chloroflexota bacterium]MCY3936762.1 serine protease [Chloroflexota bacterium]
MLPTSNILQRTFQLRFSGSQGTCFTIDVTNRQYIVTAKHLVKSVVDQAVLEVKHDDTWKALEVDLVGHCEGAVDISVLASGTQLSPTHPLSPSTAGLTLGQDVFFLGFPYGLANEVANLNRDFPLPLVKKATFSAYNSANQPLLLDGHNNPGFSGGPIVFTPQGSSPPELSVAGVISGYQWEFESVYLKDERTALAYKSNTGIIIAYSIKNAVDLIGQNPIGFELPT